MGNLKEPGFDLKLGKKAHVFRDLDSPDLHFCKDCTLEDHCGRCTAAGLNNHEHCEDRCFWLDSQSIQFKDML